MAAQKRLVSLKEGVDDVVAMDSVTLTAESRSANSLVSQDATSSQYYSDTKATGTSAATGTSLSTSIYEQDGQAI
ncbi:hypothetical protein ACOMHN_047179 [Nucella lapillus]